jgi:hypothetical protein
MRAPLRSAGLLLLLVGLAVLAWYPMGHALIRPGDDQVWESFGIGSSCSTARYVLGWTGSDSTSVGIGALFTASLAAGLVSRAACSFAVIAHLSPLQGYLVVGLALSFALAAITSRLHGFGPTTSLAVGFLICTAPFCFSRVGHLSLATAWAVVPALLACHGLWRAMASAEPLWRALLAGALASALCLPTQDYYVSFSLLLGLCTFALLLLIASTRSTDLPPLASAAGRGLCFGAGFGFVLLLLFSTKLSAVLVGSASGGALPPPLWGSPRSAIEQFRYGLLPYTWLIPSPWVELVQKQLAAAGIALNSESYAWSTGSLLIPLAWLVAIRRLARLRHPLDSHPPAREQTFFALLLLLCSALGLLVMTMGGLGTLFAAFVSPVLRSLNRFTVFVYGASVLLLVSEFQLWLEHRQPRDPRRLLWGLLAFWTGVELLYSSRWWPPNARPAAITAPTPAPTPPAGLRTLLSAYPDDAVWFAPYITFPETGFLESNARRGVYDTFLAFPTATGLASNYGAGRLSPADSLFSRASVQGLAAEYQLARRLGYRWYALDLGSVTDPAAAEDLCRRSPGCRLSTDRYALFPIAAGGGLAAELAALQRRIPLLPLQSAGVSWGPLLFSPFQWGPVDADPNRPLPAGAPLRVLAKPQFSFEIFRYSLDQFPAPFRSELDLADADVQLVLPPEVFAASVCIGPADGRCRSFTLGPARPRLAIGNLLVPGQVTRIDLIDLVRQQPGDVPFVVEVRPRF